MRGESEIQSSSCSEARGGCGASAAEPELGEHLVGSVKPFVNCMPAMACSLFELNALLTRGMPDLAVLTKVVRSDPVLSAQVLRTAVPIAVDANLSKALVLIGLDSLRAIVLGTPAITAGNQHFARFHSIWRHSNVAATLCERIAHFCGHADREQAYMAGLMHDIGKFALLLAELRTLSADDSEKRSGVPLHCAVGAWLARSWKLAPPLVDAIESHHEPSLTACTPVVGIVAAADALCSLVRVDQEYETVRTLAPIAADNVLRRSLPFLTARERLGLAKILESELIRYSGLEPAADSERTQ